MTFVANTGRDRRVEGAGPEGELLLRNVSDVQLRGRLALSLMRLCSSISHLQLPVRGFWGRGLTDCCSKTNFIDRFQCNEIRFFLFY